AIAEGGTEAYVAYAVLVAAMVGVMQLAMGVARLGFLVNFLSHPVVSGFTSAAALIIGLSQLQHLLGVKLARSHHIHTILIEAGRRIGEVNLLTLAIGLGSISLLLALQKLSPKFPRALAVVVVGTLAVVGLGLHERGVAIVGEVPAGLPSPTLPPLDVAAIASLWPTALAISLVGFMESISVAKGFARRNRYEVDANKELIALGAANIVAGLFKGYPVTGGFSRTAVNAQAGAKSGVAGIVTAVVIGLTLLFLTSLFFYLPKAVLAAIIMVAVFGLIDVAEVKHLWKVNRADFALLLLTFVATLGLGIEEGILVGVGASLLWFVVRTTRPHTAVLGRLPGTEVYRNLQRYPEAQPVPGILALRIDAQFYFGNVTFLKQTLDSLLRERAEQGEPVFAVVLDAAGVNHLDSSADAALHEILADFAERGITLYVAGPKGPVRDAMQRSGLWERLEGKRGETVHEVVGLAMKARAAQTAKVAEAA
ncbi:MAG: sulfate permease, partial [Myxococcales bacterium]|nr:sulfate permease [Myxococcales bacterium]